MKNWNDPFISQDSGVTYVEGLGFVPPRPRTPVTTLLRRMATALCLILILLYPLQQMFRRPFSYVAFWCGMDITINRTTGMIVASPESQILISLFTNAAALLVIWLLYRLIYSGAYRSARLFKRPAHGTILVGLPILVATGLMGNVIAFFFSQIFQTFGIVLDSLPAKITDFSSVTLLTVISTLLLSILEEIVFRGMILTPLRRFGDSFAIIASALIYAVCAQGPVNATAAFLFGLAAGYFVVRSGSIQIAIIGRLCFEGIQLALRTSMGMLHSPALQIILAATFLVVLALAFFAYLHFLHRDPDAFYLMNSPDGLPVGRKVEAFCGSVGFIFLFILLLCRIINTVQLIGGAP